MSGIYIENAKLPEQGDDLIIFEDGSVWTTMRPTRGYFRIDGAIAVEVPDHGDLIDRGYAIATACSGLTRTLPTTEDGERWIRVKEVRENIKTAPTIIPADK